MAKNNNNPEIRFKGFDEDWEDKKLGDISKIIGGGTPSTMIPEYWNGNIDWYSPTEIGKEIYANGSNKKITTLGYENCSAKILPQDKTILFTSRAGIGDMAILKKEGTTNQGFQSLILNEDINPYFIYSAGFLIKKYSLKNASGSTFLEISSKTLEKMVIKVPKPSEQKQIGNFFQNLDSLITQHQKKHDKLVILKKAMLNKMFPKNGAKVPEIRFKGFTGNWEEKELGNIGNPYTGLSGKTKVDFGHGNARYITYMNVFSNPVADTKLIEPIEIDSTQNTVLKGDVLFSVSSETADEVGMSSVWISDLENIYLNSFCFGYRPNIKIHNYFLANLLRSSTFRKNITFLAQGISRFNISKSKVMEISISLPKYDEQQKIGEYFKNLDMQISLHNTQLEKLKNIKKACLSKMFVSQE